MSRSFSKNLFPGPQRLQRILVGPLGIAGPPMEILGPQGPLGTLGSPGDCKVFCMSFACPRLLRVFWGKFWQVGTVLDKQVGQSLWELGIIWDPFGTIWDNW